MAEAYRAKAGEDGRVKELSVYVDEGSSATDAGRRALRGRRRPSRARSWTPGRSRPDQGWSTVALNAKVAKGERYWIAVLGTGGALKVRNHATGDASARPAARAR